MMSEAARQKRYAYTKEWRKRNVKHLAEYSKRYRAENPYADKTPARLERRRHYYLKHREENKERCRNRYSLKKEEYKKSQKIRYQLNKAEISERQKAYNIKNKFKLQEASAKRYRRNPELMKLRVNEWGKKFPDRVKGYKKKWSDAHKLENVIRAKERRAKLKGILTDENKRRLVREFFGWVKNQDYVTCTYCRCFISGKGIEIDHIIPLARGGDHHPDNFALSCRTCNASKSDYMLSEWPGCPEALKAN
jgi:5-methylcytosine-specific restriction endonuclease McrA